MPKEVGCEDFLQAVSSDPVLLRQEALTCRKHAGDAAAMETTQMCQGEGSRIEAKYLKASRAPGEETSEKGFHVKMCIWHDACVQVETVQPVVPAAGKQMSSSHRADAPVKTCPTGQDGGGNTDELHLYYLQTEQSVSQKLLPQFDFLCCCNDGGDAAGVHLQQGHLGHGVRGEEGRASSLCSLHVPAGETQLEPPSVL